MESLQDTLAMKFWGNSLQQYLITLGISVLVLIGLFIVEKIILRRLRRLSKVSQTFLDDYFFTILDATRVWFLIVIALYAGSRTLTLSDKFNHYARMATVVLFLLQVGVWGKTALEAFLRRYRETKVSTDAAAVTSVNALGFLLKLLLYSLILLLILENTNVDVTALITGLGISGIAVALAAQSILGDLFASLGIFMDKPFVIGDFIIVDDVLGSVEAVGIKTTRLRSISGEQIILSNSDLMKSRIRNFKRMYKRRVVFSLGVTYQTSLEKVKNIPKIIKETIEKQEKTSFDRAHFKDFGDSALNFEVVYFVLSGDFNTYRDIHQSINLEIFGRFEEEQIEFAYPTQTLFVEPTQIRVEKVTDLESAQQMGSTS